MLKKRYRHILETRLGNREKERLKNKLVKGNKKNY